MARLKRDLQPENKNKSTIVTGKVTKTKNNNVLPDHTHARKIQLRLPRTPNGKIQRTTGAEKSILKTPFSINSLLKHTSTPFNKEQEKTPMRANTRQTDLRSPENLRSPLSPIHGNISNLNKNSSPTEKNPPRFQKEGNMPTKNETKIKECRDQNVKGANRIGTRRKSIGVRKIVASDKNVPSRLMSLSKDHKQSAKDTTLIRNLHGDWTSTTLEDSLTTYFNDSPKKQDKYRNNICSSLRARTVRRSSKSNTSLRNKEFANNRSTQENTLIKGIMNDWPSIRIEKTPYQNQPSNLNKNAKRRLTTLAEVSIDESISHKEPVEVVTRDDPYSSSEEFQSNDDSRSKRAPTWKDISKKTNEFVSSSVGKPRRSRKSKRLSGESESDQNSDGGCAARKELFQDSPHVPEELFELTRDPPSKDDTEVQMTMQPEETPNKTKSNALKKKNAWPKVKVRRLKKARILIANETDSEVISNEERCLESIAKDPKAIDELNQEVGHSSEEAFRDVSNNITVKGNTENKKEIEANKQSKLNKIILSPTVKVKRLQRITRFRRLNANETVSQKTDSTIKADKKTKIKDNGISSIPETEGRNSIAKDCETIKELHGQFHENLEEAFKDISFELAEGQPSTENSGKQSQEILGTRKENATSANMTIENDKSNNLHDKSKSIEDSICFPDHDEMENVPSIDLTTSKYPHKFFHSRSDKNLSLKINEKPAKQRGRRSTKKKQENVYEFLSQSSSDSIKPVDDVIQKLIKTGKVTVAKHIKKLGRPVVKRNRKATAKKIKIPKNKEALAQLKPWRKPQPLQEIAIEVDDDFHFDDGGEVVPVEEPKRDQRGFSDLARSAMIKQADRSVSHPKRKSITDRKKLLSMALKIVSQSTPIRKTPEPRNTPVFSPSAGNKSPWRVDNDNLPSLFYLGRNSANLPSFSSDHIPMTPSKNKSKSMSSFSSNDSNMENIAPLGSKSPANENAIQALGNTRRALSSRSPLKTINIIEVVNLPPLALHTYGPKIPEEKLSKNKSHRNVSNQNTTDLFASIHDENHNGVQEYASIMSPSKSVKESSVGPGGDDQSNVKNMFGFDELINEDDDLTNVTLDKTILPNKENLKEKLKRLQNLKPAKLLPTASNKNVIKPVFDDVRPKQKTLKQMLCSTMIENPHTNHLANHDARKDSFNEDVEDLSQLFKDPEPETTFNDSLPVRTYNRPFKRKRKLRNNFVMFMDSDASDDDEEEEEDYKRRNNKANQNKRQKKPPKNDPELKKFVDEFNEMCKEVSQYEIMVE